MTQMIETLVVDDEPLAAALIRSYVERTPFLHLAGEVHTAEEALDIMAKGNIELVYLDIKMPRLSGMQVARMLPPGVRVVFTTAYSDHAVEGFRVGALDYLLKPVSYEEFLESATRALRDLTPAESRIQPGGHLLVKSEYRLLRIPFGDIEFIEGLRVSKTVFRRLILCVFTGRLLSISTRSGSSSATASSCLAARYPFLTATAKHLWSALRANAAKYKKSADRGCPLSADFLLWVR